MTRRTQAQIDADIRDCCAAAKVYVYFVSTLFMTLTLVGLLIWAGIL